MKLNKNISYKQKVLIALSLNLIVLFLIVYFFITPYIDSVKAANKALIGRRTEFETMLIKEKKFSKISQNLSKIESEIDKIDRAFINKNNKLEFITMIEGLAEHNSLSLDMNIDFEAIEKNKTVPLRLTVIGTYNNLMNFLVSIENLNYYINVNDVSISSAGRSATGNENESSFTMNINSNTYWK